MGFVRKFFKGDFSIIGFPPRKLTKAKKTNGHSKRYILNSDTVYRAFC